MAPVRALGSVTVPPSMVALTTPGALVTKTPLPVRAVIQAALPSVLSGTLLTLSVRVVPAVVVYCTPLAVSVKGFWVEPWPPNR